MQMYLVGGIVRDRLLGIPSKDVDFSVVLPPGSYANPYQFMNEELESQGFKIYQARPEYLTTRAKFPADYHVKEWRKLDADFVLARREGAYSDNRRPDEVFVGTLQDDLARRDFTMNAIAQAEDGSLIDPFHGVRDINERLIRAVGNPWDRLVEDPLRALRAVRFAVTKGFTIDPNLAAVIRDFKMKKSIFSLPEERIYDEMMKMFRVDTVESIAYLNQFGLLEYLFGFGRALWLKPSLEPR